MRQNMKNNKMITLVSLAIFIICGVVAILLEFQLDKIFIKSYWDFLSGHRAFATNIFLAFSTGAILSAVIAEITYNNEKNIAVNNFLKAIHRYSFLLKSLERLNVQSKEKLLVKYFYDLDKFKNHSEVMKQTYYTMLSEDETDKLCRDVSHCEMNYDNVLTKWISIASYDIDSINNAYKNLNFFNRKSKFKTKASKINEYTINIHNEIMSLYEILKRHSVKSIKIERIFELQQKYLLTKESDGNFQDTTPINSVVIQIEKYISDLKHENIT